MAQKLAQFRGLCDKNNTVTKEEDPFVPTSHDLAGFWDMVHIQVEQVHNRFATLRKLSVRRMESQGWGEEGKQQGQEERQQAGQQADQARRRAGAAKARDEARKKMQKSRKKAMRENQNQPGSESDLIIIM